MKKHWFLVILILVFLLIFFSGCSQPQEETPRLECQKNSECKAPDNCFIAQCTNNQCGVISKCSDSKFSGCEQGICIPKTICGNGYCQETENFESCATDCPPTEITLTPTGEECRTGISALPNVRFYWNWGDNAEELPMNTCEPTGTNPIYCDPTQFLITIMKRLHTLDEAEKDFMQNPAKYSSLTNFEANLIGDNYSKDFLHDFAQEQGFFEAPSWFEDPSMPWKNYLTKDRIEVTPQKITSGKYKVEMQIEIFVEKGFNIGSEPNAKINIKLTKISDAENNPFYYLPINGKIGLQTGKQDYGIKFTNNNEPIQITDGFLLERASGAKTTETNIPKDFEGMNTGNTRGQVLEITKNAEQILYSPNTPIPLLAVFDSENAINGLSYKLFSNNQDFEPRLTSIANWTAFATEKGCTNKAGNTLPYYFNDAKQTGCEGGTGKSFSVAKPSKNKEKIFYSTTIYKPSQQQLSLKPCATENIFQTKNAIAQNTETVISLEENSPEKQITSIQKIFELVKKQQVCIIQKQDSLKFYWNQQKTEQEIQQYAQQFSDSTITNCANIVPVPPKAPAIGLVSHYKFEENAKDSVGQNHGTIKGGAGFAQGKKGKAIKLDDRYDYVTVEDSDSLDIRDALTLSAWIKPDQAPLLDRYVILEKIGRGYYLTYDKDKKLAVYWHGTTFPGFHVSNSTIEPGKWTHVAAVWDGNNVKLYINGNFDKASKTKTPGNATTGSLAIGFGSELERRFKGMIDEVRIYNKALNGFEIREIYNEETKINDKATNNIDKFTLEYAEWLKKTNFINYLAQYVIVGNNAFHPENAQYKFLYVGTQFKSDGKSLSISLETPCAWTNENEMDDDGMLIRDISLSYLATGDERLKKATTFLLKGMSALQKGTPFPEVASRTFFTKNYVSKTEDEFGDVSYILEDRAKNCVLTFKNGEKERKARPLTQINNHPVFGTAFIQNSHSTDDFSGYYNAYYSAKKLRQKLSKTDSLGKAAEEFIGYAGILADDVIKNKDNTLGIPKLGINLCTYPLADIRYPIDYDDSKYIVPFVSTDNQKNYETNGLSNVAKGSVPPIVNYKDQKKEWITYTKYGNESVYYNEKPEAKEAFDNAHCFVKALGIELPEYHADLWNLHAIAPNYKLSDELLNQELDNPIAFKNEEGDEYEIKRAQSYVAALGIAQLSGDLAPQKAKLLAFLQRSKNQITKDFNEKKIYDCGGGCDSSIAYAALLTEFNGVGVDLSASEQAKVMEAWRKYMDIWKKKFGVQDNGKEINPWLVTDNKWRPLVNWSYNWLDATRMLAPLANCGTEKQGTNKIVNCELLLKALGYSS